MPSIVVGGPPHSGKSVFLFALKRLLPIGSYMPVRAAPDGEGDWTQKLYKCGSELVKDLRIKGRFSEAFVDWAAESVRNCTARFGLIDIGGIPSKENRRICADADAMIILAGDPEKIAEWQAFADDLGLQVLAIVHSRLTDLTPDAVEWSRVREDGVFEGQALNLDRAKFEHSSTIEQLVSFLLETIPAQESKEDSMNTLTISQIATLIGKRQETYTLPNGREVTGLNWRPADLKKLKTALAPFAMLGVPWLIDGPGPQWLIGAFLEALHPCALILADNKVEGGRVPIGQRKYPEAKGRGELKFEVSEMNKGMIVCYSSENPISAELLPELVPPAIEDGKVVLLNGRTATWGVVEMVSCYMHVAPAVFVGQPTSEGYMYVCVCSHAQEYEMGDVIWEKDLVEA